MSDTKSMRGSNRAAPLQVESESREAGIQAQRVNMQSFECSGEKRRMKDAGDVLSRQRLTENRQRHWQRQAEVREARRTKDGCFPCRWDRLRLRDGDERESGGERNVRDKREVWAGGRRAWQVWGICIFTCLDFKERMCFAFQKYFITSLQAWCLQNPWFKVLFWGFKLHEKTVLGTWG